MSAGSNQGTAPSILRERLKRRSDALQKARSFFLDRGLVETDCLILGNSAAIDLHIDLFKVPSPIHGIRYLFSSPEYPMKRLIASGAGDIFYLGHVFRHEEAGHRHSPEFTMAEWYRVGFSFSQMIQETVDFILHILESEASPSTSWTIESKSYEELFQETLNINPHAIESAELQKTTEKALQKLSLTSPIDLTTASHDDMLHLLMSFCIEPVLKKKKTISILTHYPHSQAALAQTITSPHGNWLVSERFEIYVEGVEIANGYHELCDAIEQETRFHIDNQERVNYGKEAYPIDMRFLTALRERGLPPSCGVAVGFDRLLMASWGVSDIHETQPIGWNEA